MSLCVLLIDSMCVVEDNGTVITASTNVTLTGLEEDTSYNVTVRTESLAAVGDPSAPITASTSEGGESHDRHMTTRSYLFIYFKKFFSSHGSTIGCTCHAHVLRPDICDVGPSRVPATQ